MPLPTVIQADEHTRLLSNDDRIPSTTDAATTKDKARLRTQLVVILFVCVLYFNVYLCLAPEVSIRENIICKAYYDGLDNDENWITAAGHPERDCTVDDVQRELSLLSQVYVTIAQLPGRHQSTSYRDMSTVLRITCVCKMPAADLFDCLGFLLVFPYGVLGM
jgi:hypothetical protein